MMIAAIIVVMKLALMMRIKIVMFSPPPGKWTWSAVCFLPWPIFDMKGGGVGREKERERYIF